MGYDANPQPYAGFASDQEPQSFQKDEDHKDELSERDDDLGDDFDEYIEFDQNHEESAFADKSLEDSLNSLFMHNTAKKEKSYEPSNSVPQLNPYSDHPQMMMIDETQGLFKDESSVEMRIVGETIGKTPLKELGGSS